MAPSTPREPLESRRFLLKMAGVVVAAPLLGAACGGSTDAADQGDQRKPPREGDVVVEARALTFVPKDITVKVGTRVVWVWTEKIAHNVVAKEFRSQIYSDGYWSYVFTKPGKYDYDCTLHAGMVGTVTVE